MKMSISATNLYYYKCKIYLCVPPTILHAFIKNTCKLSKITQQNKAFFTPKVFWLSKHVYLNRNIIGKINGKCFREVLLKTSVTKVF